jgi:hypothetical protein
MGASQFTRMEDLDGMTLTSPVPRTATATTSGMAAGPRRGIITDASSTGGALSSSLSVSQSPPDSPTNRS